MKKRSVITLAIFLFAISLLPSFACGVNKETLQPTWKYPDDKKFVMETSKTGRYRGLNLPEEVQYQLVKYKEPGLLVKAPDGRGWWEFREVYKLTFNGKAFAIMGKAYFPSLENGKITSYAACLTEAVIYDEQGSGVFDRVTGTLDHIPAWARKQEDKQK